MLKSQTDVRESVASGLLRLTPERRVAFDRMLELMNVPKVDSPGVTAAALSGLVYAAAFDPDGLLVNEDPRLLSKHQFAGGRDDLFSPAKLVASNQAPGSYLSGGFVNIDDVSRKLARGGRLAARAETGSVTAGPAGQSDILASEATFRAEGRLVEVYATVTDGRGHYVDDLNQDQFTIMEQGEARAAAAFESRSAEVSVALLLDTTGSMQAALPALKNAALKLIGDLRPSDFVAVYSFNNTVSELQPFSTDKNAAKRAVLRTEPFGETALYDALARVNRDLSGRSGKKVIVVFTDGDDNASTITSQAAIQRAKAAGVPVYTIAQGAALTNPEFLKQLAGVSQSTGGVAYSIRNPGEIRGSVREYFTGFVAHLYFFAFQPAPAEDPRISPH